MAERPSSEEVATPHAAPAPGEAAARGRAWPRRHPGWTLLGVLAAAVVVLVLLWDWNWFKRPIEYVVHARTGRELHLDGNLDVDLGRMTRVSVERLRFANASWAEEEEMAKAERLELAFELFPALFRRDVRIPELRLTRPDLLLEIGPDGLGNWVLKNHPDSRGLQPQFRRLWIEAGQLRFEDPRSRTGFDVAVQSQPPAARDSGPPISVRGKGRWKGNPLTLQGRGESPLDLRDPDEPYTVDVHASAGSTHAHARGTLLDPLRLRDFDLQLALSGQNLEDLYPLLGLAIPATPPYTLDGRLTRVVHARQRSTWKYDGFTGRVGDSDLSGFAHFTTGKPRPFLKADLRSRRLDMDDLAGFIGGAPAAGQGERTNAELAAKAAARAASPRLFPDEPFRLDKLRAMDADVRFRAARINTRRLPLDDMDARLHLRAGLLTLTPLNFGMADGDIRSTIRLDARQSTIRTRADIRASGLTLGKLLPKVRLGRNALGKVGGDVDVDTHGNSIAAMMANADGEAQAGMGEGRISKLLMEMAAIDIAGILKIKLTHDRQIPIRCAFADFTLQDGLMATRSLAFDTSETVILGDGRLDLRQERLALVLKPKTRRFSPLSLRAPLHLEGTFKHPDLRPDYTRVGLRAATAALLGTATAPAAALVATADPGNAKAQRYCGNTRR